MALITAETAGQVAITGTWFEARMIAHHSIGYGQSTRVVVRRTYTGYEVWNTRTRFQPIHLLKNEAKDYVKTDRHNGRMIECPDQDNIQHDYAVIGNF